mgnify:CR=1 FL=1
MVQQNNSVARNWREQRGAGERTSPGLFQPSTSEGDKRRQSLGPGRFVGTSVQYVANDDGSPIAETLEQILIDLLGKLIAETRAVKELLGKLLIEVEKGRTR